MFSRVFFIGFAAKLKLYGFEKDIYTIEFSIKDTGIGISEDHIEKLFKPFIQEDASINRRFGGTGLGLSIVKNLTEMMSGTIEVSSQLGQGTEFCVRIKLKVDAKREQESKSGFEYIKGIKTLVLNRDMNSLNLIVNYLKKFSIKTEFTSSETQFRSLITEHRVTHAKPYDLLIVYEETMPASCQQVYQKLLSDPDLKQLPKMICVKPQSSNVQLESLEDNVVVIYEPFLPSLLYNAIATLYKFKVMASQVEGGIENNNRSRKTGRVLIVEDNLTNQMIAKELLAPTGLIIDTAGDGYEGLKYLETNDYGLILMDLHMPNMNGFDATIEIRKKSQTPIIAMTADAIQGIREQCLSIGMNDFISKPFVPDQFIQKVTRYFENKKVEDVINHELGLSLMGGNQELYDKVCKLFYEENDGLVERLDQLIINESYSEAEQVIHKVKSSAGSIGAEGVRNIAKDLQNALSEGSKDAINTLSEAFKKEFNEVIRSLENNLTG